ARNSIVDLPRGMSCRMLRSEFLSQATFGGSTMPLQSTVDERRTSPRRCVDAIAGHHLQATLNGMQVVTVRDISRSGIRLIVPFSVEADHSAALELLNLINGVAISRQMRVVHIAANERDWSLGCAFDEGLGEVEFGALLASAI